MMSTDLKEQIRTYIEYFDTTLTAEVETSVSKPARHPSLRWKGWVYAVAAAVAVLVLVGGISLWVSGPFDEAIADQDLSLTDWTRVGADSGVFDLPGEVVISGVFVAGDLLVAVGDWDAGESAAPEGEDDGLIVLTSLDGEVWTRQPTTGGLGADIVASTPQGFVAVGDGVWTSPDGFNWTSQELVPEIGDQTSFNGVVSTDSGLFAYGSTCSCAPDTSSVDFRAVIWTSQDGVTWELVLEETSMNEITHIAVNESGLVAEAIRWPLYQTPSMLFVSPNGEDWQVVESVLPRLSSITVIGGHPEFMSIGHDMDTDETVVATSVDGVSWVEVTRGTDRLPPTEVRFRGRIIQDNYLIASPSPLPGLDGTYVLVAGNSPITVWTSTDGVTWASNVIDNGSSVFAKAFTTHASSLVVVGSDDGRQGAVWRSNPHP